MAQEVSETSVASSCPTPNCWEIHAPLSSWNYSHINRWQPHSHHSTSSSCDEDNSISNTTSLMDSSSADLSGDPPDNNLWSQVLLNVGGGVEMHHHQNHEDGENFLEVLSSKSLPSEIYDPACDYLKKMDSSSWEMNNFNGGLMEHERFTNLSDLVKNWSLAPPANSQFDHVQIAPSSLACNVPINPLMSSNSHIKHEQLLPNNGVLSSNYLPYMHEIKMENQHQDHINGYQFGVNNTITGFDNKFHSPISADVSWSSSSRSLSDLISFKPVQFRTSKQVLKGSDHSSHDAKISSSTRGSGRSTGTTNEGKKKRSEENNSEALLKKSKLENSSSSSSVKMQVPKVKFADRISALQQIVSPFGKTDTASVLMEAINYIRFLQEQVQLLSDPYMKLNANMEQNSWGGMERKEKDKVDLKARGLCLVPISCTPQAYRENSGPDYWTPTYRGCLYR